VRLYGEGERRTVLAVMLHVLGQSLKLIHPIMPYVTEEIWSCLPMTKGLLLENEQFPLARKIISNALCRFGFRSRDLLRKIPNVKPVLVQECCGHNGTYAMTVEGFAPSKRIGQKAFDAMRETGAAVWSTDCPLAALQFQQHAGVKAMHPMSILARAYRADGFPQRVQPDPEPR
jgi:hypothetical protein